MSWGDYTEDFAFCDSPSVHHDPAYTEEDYAYGDTETHPFEIYTGKVIAEMCACKVRREPGFMRAMQFAYADGVDPRTLVWGMIIFPRNFVDGDYSTWHVRPEWSK